MPYDPGTLLIAKPAVLKSKIELFKSYSISPYFTHSNNWWYVHNPEEKPKHFQVGDNIFVIDYYGVKRDVYERKYEHTDYFYRVWVNGSEAKMQAIVLELEDYYGVVK